MRFGGGWLTWLRPSILGLDASPVCGWRGALVAGKCREPADVRGSARTVISGCRLFSLGVFDSDWISATDSDLGDGEEAPRWGGAGLP